MTAPDVAQPLHDERVARGTILGERERAGGVDHAGGVDVVLDQNREAVQRPAHLARPALGIARVGVGERGGVHLDDRVQPRSRIVDRRDAIEIGLRQRARRELARGHPIARIDSAQLRDVQHGRAAVPRRRRRGGLRTGPGERGDTRRGRHVEQAASMCSRHAGFPRSSIKRWPKAAPLPASSCLKYTKTSDAVRPSSETTPLHFTRSASE